MIAGTLPAPPVAIAVWSIMALAFATSVYLTIRKKTVLRLVEKVIAGGLLVCVAPLMLILALSVRASSGHAFHRGRIWAFRASGRLGRVLEDSGLAGLPALLNVATGDLQFRDIDWETPETKIARVCLAKDPAELREALMASMRNEINGDTKDKALILLRFNYIGRLLEADDRPLTDHELNSVERLDITEKDLRTARPLLGKMRAVYSEARRTVMHEETGNLVKQSRPADHLRIAKRVRARTRGHNGAVCTRSRGSRRIASRSSGGGGDPPGGGDPDSDSARHPKGCWRAFASPIVVGFLLLAVAAPALGSDAVSPPLRPGEAGYREFDHILNTPDPAGDQYRAFRDFEIQRGKSIVDTLTFHLSRSEMIEELDAQNSAACYFMDGVWKMGDHEEKLIADLRDPAMRRPALCDDALNRLRRIALMARFQDVVEHPERGYWSWQLNVEISLIAQTSGIDYVVTVPEDAEIPDEDLFWVWASEIEAGDREEGALAFEWEAFLARREGDEVKAAELDKEAAEGRRAAIRWRKEARKERLRIVRPSAARRQPQRQGQSRSSHGAPRRFRGSRRVSRSAGGGDPGDGDPDPESPPPTWGTYNALMKATARG